MKKLEDYTRDELLQIVKCVSHNLYADYFASVEIAAERKNDKSFVSAMMMHMDTNSMVAESLDEIGAAINDEYVSIIKAMKISRKRFNEAVGK